MATMTLVRLKLFALLALLVLLIVLIIGSNVSHVKAQIAISPATTPGSGSFSTICPSTSDTQVLFNDGNACGGDAALTFVKSTGTLAATTFTGTAGLLKYVHVPLSNAQLKSIKSTPVTAIAAPANGSYLVPNITNFDFIYGGNNAFTGCSTFGLVWHGTSSGASSVAFSGTGTASYITTQSGAGATLTGHTATAIDVWSANADCAGNAGNDNTAVAEIWYTISTP